MNRRTFLLLSTISILMAACKQRVDERSTNKESILIIGAGISGLAAARKLYNLGYNVTLLEARNIIGGRVWTSHLWPEAPIDLGASWIHGTKDNPLTKLADKARARRIPTNYENSILYGTEGYVVSDEVAQEIEYLFNTLVETVYRNASDDETIFEVLERTPLWGSLSKKQQQYVIHAMNTTIEHEFSGALDEISGANPDDSDEFSGDDVIFPDGYSVLIDYLARGLDIRLEHVVEKISYTSEGVIIKTSQSELLADRVIVTLPIGVLKHGSVQFEPQFPTRIQKSIDTIGSGLLDKLFLKFPYVFWEKEREILNWVSAEHGRWNEWLNVSAYVDKPILLGFNAADYARKTEMWNDEEIVFDAMSVLRTIYGNEIPEPESWQITRWGTDPFAFGSYSFNAVGASFDSRVTLAESIENRIFIAGEATSENYPSTVHGAYISGIDVAKAIAGL